MPNFLPRLNQLAASIALAAGSVALMPTAQAAAPAAGTSINNVATASYTDNTGAAKSTTSNTVTATVLQVSSFTLTADRTGTVNANGLVSLPHTLENTGNATDSFTFSVTNNDTRDNTTDNFDFNNFQVFLDLNQDGIPDSATPISGPITVNAGQKIGIVVQAKAASTAAANDVGKYTVNATSTYGAAASGNGDITKKNVDTITITQGAVINVTKSVSASTAKAGDIIEYTLTYVNSGNAPATGVVITDDLNQAGLKNVTYEANSAISSSLGALNDASSDSDGYVYDSTTKKITFTIPTVGANSTATLKFKVKVGATPGDISNIAQFDPDGTGPLPQQSTNPTKTTIASTFKGTINDSATDTFADGQTPTDPNANDALTATTSQGVPVSFGAIPSGETIWVHNTGDTAETFNLTAAGLNLPNGSTIALLKSDGDTPWTSTDGDSIVDTGSIPAGGKVQVVVRVTLPATDTGATAPYNVEVHAKPIHNSAVDDKVTLSITAVTANRVDLSNGKGNEDGINNDTPNAGEGAATTTVIDTRATAPGVTTTFPLAVTNLGTTPDTFNITSNLPAGWTVQYVPGTSTDGGTTITCSGSPVSNTGNVNPYGTGTTGATGSTVYLCAQVTPPTNATPSDSRDIVFTVTSQGTGLTDSITDHINITAARNLAFASDANGQVTPGGAKLYSHILQNNGNVTEGTGATAFTYTTLLSQTGNLGASTSVYIDVNGDGIAQNNELVDSQAKLDSLLDQVGSTSSNSNYTAAGLQPGEKVTVLVKVEAPQGATANQYDVSTITFTPAGGTAVSVKDTTVVNIGQVGLVKEQAPDLNCDGTEDIAYAQTGISAKPGQCVLYRITATNNGNQPVTNVIINDATPQYTAISNVASNDGTTGTVTGPASGQAGSVSNNIGDLAPTATAKLKFGVKVDQ